MLPKRIFSVIGFLVSGLVYPQQFDDLSVQNLPPIVRGNHNSMDAAVADIDNDGDPDIVVAVEFVKNVILLNDGKGRFSDGSHLLPDMVPKTENIPYSYYPYHDSEDIAIEDFDKDGDLDIIFVTEDDQVNEYYLNNGSSFDDNSNELPFKGISNAVIAADFDGDTYLDLIIGNRGQNFYIRNNKGMFLDETTSRMPEIDDITQDIEANDFDKDGDLDLIIANEKENYLLLNDGKGYFSEATEDYIDSLFQESGETREADFGDINGDGLTDLFFANVLMFQQTPPIQRLLINKQPEFVDETQQRLGFTDKFSIMDVDIVDIDQDKDVDLIFASLNGPVFMQNDGKGYFKDITAETLGKSTLMGVDIEVADFNGDGKMDIYLANFRGPDRLFIQR